MKKITIALMLVFALILVGCNQSKNENEQQGDDKAVEKDVARTDVTETLTLQLLKADEEAGVTIENSEVYKVLDQMITENPDIGIDNDFSIYIIDIVDSGTEDAALLFLGINRLDEAIKDISFDYTLGHENGEFVWDGVEVNLSEEDAGVIQSNHAVPFSLGITPEQEAVIDSLDDENQVVKIENFSFKSAK